MHTDRLHPHAGAVILSMILAAPVAAAEVPRLVHDELTPGVPVEIMKAGAIFEMGEDGALAFTASSVKVTGTGYRGVYAATGQWSSGQTSISISGKRDSDKQPYRLQLSDVRYVDTGAVAFSVMGFGSVRFERLADGWVQRRGAVKLLSATGDKAALHALAQDPLFQGMLIVGGPAPTDGAALTSRVIIFDEESRSRAAHAAKKLEPLLGKVAVELSPYVPELYDMVILVGQKSDGAPAPFPVALVPTQTPTLYGDLKRVKLGSVIPGLEHYDGMRHYSFARGGKVKMRGPMGELGTGTWTHEGNTVRASGTGVSDEDVTHDTTWSVELTDVWGGDTLLVYGENSMAKYTGDGFAGTVGATVVMVIPGAADRALYGLVLRSRALAQADAVIQGRQAKNPRATTEIWWNSTSGKEDAARMAKMLAPIVGKVEPRQWTFGGPPYDVIVVAGERAAP